MADLDVELDRDLLEGVRRLAMHLYGDSSDASLARVVEVALEMRLLWQDRASVSADDIEEPVANWEFGGNGSPTERLPHEVAGWLFRRRGDASNEGDHKPRAASELH